MINPPDEWSRWSTEKEREHLRGRLERLGNPGLKAHLAALDERLLGYERDGGQLREKGLRIRQSFVYLSDPIEWDSSDRKVPPRHLRPPATRISTSRGAALRLELTIMALLQLHRKPGARANLPKLQIPIAGDRGRVGWADLIANFPADSTGAVHYTSRNKRARSVQNALKGLAEAGLVSVPGDAGVRNRYEGFAALSEATATQSDRDEYAIPLSTEAEVFSMPPGFILNGWVHVLADSELAVLMMAACGAGSWQDDELRVFPGAIRVNHYGIHRDPYATARKTLEWFGLLRVREVGRHADGRAEDGEQYVHRIGLRAEGFGERALPIVQSAITRQLKASD